MRQNEETFSDRLSLKMKVPYSLETSVNIKQSTWHTVAQGWNLLLNNTSIL